MSDLENYNLIIKKLNSLKINYYLISYNDEFLNEITPKEKNIIYSLTGFKGENSYLLLSNKKSYLFVDGRFTIEAKKTIKNKKISIITIDSSKSIYDYLREIVNNNKLFLDYKYFSINFIEKLKLNISVNKDTKIIKDLLSKASDDCDDFEIYDSYIISNKYKDYVFDNVKKELENVTNNKNYYYVSINSEEISYFTNLRIRPNEHNIKRLCSILFNGYIIINNKKTILYTDINVDKLDLMFLSKQKIIVKNKIIFFKDIKALQKNSKIKIYIDKKINTYEIFNIIKNPILIDSPIKRLYSIKSDKEIKNIMHANIIDGACMVILQNFIDSIDFEKAKTKEYTIKIIVDHIRDTFENKLNIKKSFIIPSFSTIVAYKDNSSICHYEPNEENSKTIKNDSVLLIDSGGHYLYGTTDVTRVYSLYKKEAPNDVKKDYTLVLKSLINTMKQKFLYGTHGTDIDFYARSFLYNNYENFNHGTGHGIGYISNVHEGINRLSRLKIVNNDNILNVNNVQSIEPGIYKENKYGIRLENDTVINKVKSNNYGEFLEFKSLTLVPFDIRLIDKSILTKEEVKYINSYHEHIYKTLNKYFDKDLKKYLRKITKKI